MIYERQIATSGSKGLSNIFLKLQRRQAEDFSEAPQFSKPLKTYLSSASAIIFTVDKVSRCFYVYVLNYKPQATSCSKQQSLTVYSHLAAITVISCVRRSEAANGNPASVAGHSWSNLSSLSKDTCRAHAKSSMKASVSHDSSASQKQKCNC